MRLPDGRELEHFTAGPEIGMPLLFQNGTPTAAVLFDSFVDLAAARGLRLVAYSRPGYAGSSPRPGRTVADCVPDISALMDHLGAPRFLTIGWSGGGPHSLACAALLPGRCAAAASVAGVAPYGAAGLDWFGGMAEENVTEFGHALHDHSALDRYMEEQAVHLGQVDGPAVAAVLGGLVTEVDRASLTGEFAEWVAASFRRAMSAGVEGWREDNLAFTRPWGFELSAITAPVAVWQGGQDAMVPFAHGRWLAANIPGAESHLLPAEGHLSLGVGEMAAIVDDLLRLSGSSAQR